MNRYNFKKRYLAIVFCVLFLAQASVLAGELSSSLELYTFQVKGLLSDEKSENVKKYLQICFDAADNIKGLEAEDADAYAKLQSLATARFKGTNILTDQDVSNPSVNQETAAYNKYIYGYKDKQYYGLIVLQDQLLQRKYFQTETAKNSNFFESLINGRCPLTRTDNSDVARVLLEPSLGVSPWEAIFRFEPAFVFDQHAYGAILGTAGLSYTFFPEVDLTKTPASFNESFLSEYIKKSGVRIGLGVANIDSRSRTLFGTGVQINMIGLWALWELDDGNCVLGVSIGELGIINTILPWF